MSDTTHSAEHYPYFITAPGDTDTMLVSVIVVMALIALGIGVFYLKLHSLPEKMAHHSNHTQMQLVAILALIALFTHNNIFWIAALLLAAFKMPDYSGMLGSISNSLDRLAANVEGVRPTYPGGQELSELEDEKAER
ncbi:MAG: hypothetical protein AB3N23_03430 [Paracoccaceae bacterium]